MEISDEQFEYYRALENENILLHSQFEWIKMILDNEELGDFALSFPIIRDIQDLKYLAEER